MQYLKDGQLSATHSPIYLKPENRVEELLLSPPSNSVLEKQKTYIIQYTKKVNIGKSRFNPNLHGLWKKK